MYKKFLYLFLILISAVMLTACNKPKTIILFNQAPITVDNFLNNSTKFVAGKRVYYLFITEIPLESDLIRIRVYKRDEKGDMAPTKVIYSNDFKLSQEHQHYYYNDYIVIHDAGYYCMTIYALNKLDRPLAVADFQVTN